MKTQLKWSKSGALLSTALIGAVVLAGCPKDENGGGGGGIFGGGGGGAVATVNGQPVQRAVLHSQLEATGGADALRQLIEFELVMQELKKQNTQISDAEVDATIQMRSRENPQLAEAIGAGGPALEALKRQVRYQLAVDKLLTKDVKVNEEELKKWFDKSKARYDVAEGVKIGFLISSTKTRADTMAQQLKSKSKTFLQLVDEQKAANDPQAKASMAEIPQFTPSSKLPKELRVPLSKLKPGETTGVLPLGTGPQKVFAIVRLVDRQEGKKADLTAMRAVVENDFKLEKVARQVVSENPQNPPFEETLKRVEGAMMQQAMQQQRPMAEPSHHDLLSFILQNKAAELMAKVRETAKVEISDKAYAKVAEEFKPAPALSPGGASGAAPGGAAPGGAAPGAGAPPSAGAPAPSAKK